MTNQQNIHDIILKNRNITFYPMTSDNNKMYKIQSLLYY